MATAADALLIVLQGIDGAGKDGTCWHVISAHGPAGRQSHGFKQPTPKSTRTTSCGASIRTLLAKGEVAVFNRSHYEDVLVVRVHKLVPKPVWQARYDFINQWEKLLNDRTTRRSSSFSSTSRRTSNSPGSRTRLDDPGRQWKISDSDYSERDYWDDYIEAFEDALTKCSKKHAPWYVIPSNHKWFRNLAVSQIIADTMEDMNLKLPKPTVDLAKIRQLYHADSKGEAKGRDAHAKDARSKG